MPLLNDIKQHKSELEALANQYGVRNIRVFGSTVRGDATDQSDIDLLIDMEQGRSLTDLCGFRLGAKALLGREIDMVDAAFVHPALKDRIMIEAMPL